MIDNIVADHLLLSDYRLACGGRTSKTKYRMPKQDGALPAHTATAELIRTRLGTTSSRCPEWKALQKIL